ncbi:hypothetical protein Phum_PHUM058470 [Pediculus humanus corporis]|uniref:Uncharacterized protein n=1 Tax=Pediculus humanus subsp. corporis TaxID=121224 RepID=E0VBD5_PEDHC|nr:uncharacterized protein Phum_PHUM058470 [Pediculus humanus corporis]EEB10691.1 hypothetical protein Phum_PHUM058470 [Pediculus humanus corporis]
MFSIMFKIQMILFMFTLYINVSNCFMDNQPNEISNSLDYYDEKQPEPSGIFPFRDGNLRWFLHSPVSSQSKQDSTYDSSFLFSQPFRQNNY